MTRFGAFLMATIVLIASQSIFVAEGTEMSDTAKLFDELIAAGGAAYAQARAAFLAKDDAAEFLKSAESNGDDTKRWLAEILSARLSHGDEFERLEAAFDAKMPVLVLGRPNRSHVRRPSGADLYTGFLLSTEQAPKISLQYADISPGVRYEQEVLVRYYESIRLPMSDFWKPFLGEILLKGWMPSKVPSAPETKPLADQNLDENGIPRERQRTLTSDDYLRQSVLLLGKLGEQRAAPHIADLLADKGQDGRTRLLAARALGFLKTDRSMETLLSLVEDDQTAPWVRVEVFGALARLKDDRAVPALERIAANPDDTLLGAYGPRRWKAEARAALSMIQAP
jgi:hypothetical protein